MVKNTTGKQRKKLDQKKTGTYYKQRTILDSILFFLIIIAISMSALFFSFLSKDNKEYYTEYQNTDEYIENSMQTILDSTVPKVIYKNNNGVEEEFIDNSIEELILKDIYIRFFKSELNITNLERGLEQIVKNALKDIFENGQRFVLTAELDELEKQTENTENDSKLVITGHEDLEQFNENSKPTFKKLVKIPGTVSQPALAGNNVLIKLYLIN